MKRKSSCFGACFVAGTNHVRQRQPWIKILHFARPLGWSQRSSPSTSSTWLPPPPPPPISYSTTRHTSTQLAASLPMWNQAFSSTMRPHPTMHHLALAFVLGGLFFSRFLPPFLAGCAALWRRIHSKRIFTRKIRSERSKESKEPLDFDTISRPSLVVLQHVVERLAGRSFQTQMRLFPVFDPSNYTPW